MPLLALGKPAAQQALAADRFAQEIVAFLEAQLALAAADAQAVRALIRPSYIHEVFYG
jgi:hypothetical protein